jgi:hypothetical protein
MSAITQDGIPRRAIVRVAPIAVSADTLGELLGFSGGSALEAMTSLPGFPSPIYPTGSSTPRWIVREVVRWASQQAPRVSAGRKKYRPRKPRLATSPAAEQPTTTPQNPAEVIQ